MNGREKAQKAQNQSAAKLQPRMDWPQENAKDRKEETTQPLLFEFLAFLCGKNLPGIA